MHSIRIFIEKPRKTLARIDFNSKVPKAFQSIVSLAGKGFAMLVLGRKEGQSIQIGDHVRVTILRIQGNNIRVGIEAPDEVKIVRSELEPITTGNCQDEFDFEHLPSEVVLSSCK